MKNGTECQKTNLSVPRKGKWQKGQLDVERNIRKAQLGVGTEETDGMGRTWEEQRKT